MGYRKAAMMRRHQYVGGHYRRSKNGKRYWVRGHDRNAPLDFGPVKWPPIRWGLVWAIFFAPITFGLSLLIWLLAQQAREEAEVMQGLRGVMGDDFVDRMENF